MRTEIDRMVREYQTLASRERYLTMRMPGKHVYCEYPFPETSGREAQQELLEDARRRLNTLPDQILTELADGYRRQLSKLNAGYKRATDAGTRADILRERAVIIQKLRHSNLKAEVNKILEEPKRDKRLPYNGAVIPGHPQA